MTGAPVVIFARHVVAASGEAEKAFRQAKGYAQGRQDAEFGERDVHSVLDFARLYGAMVFACEMNRRRMRVRLREAYDAWSRGFRF